MNFDTSDLPTGVDTGPAIQTSEMELFIPDIIAVLKKHEIICHHADEQRNEDEAEDFTGMVLRHPTDRYAVRHNLEISYSSSSVRIFIHMAVSVDQAWIDEIQVHPHPSANPRVDYKLLNRDFDILLGG